MDERFKNKNEVMVLKQVQGMHVGATCSSDQGGAHE